MGEIESDAGRLHAPAPLKAMHDLSHFDCGNPLLNDWLKKSAMRSEGRTARTYVACQGTGVVGYYCISAGSVERKSLPPKIKRDQGLPHDIPVTIIGRLARDIRYRGTGLGADLLRDAMIRILSASQLVGIRAVLVHALDDSAKQFWKGNEFIESPLGSRTFYLPVELIADAL
ncbi:MAG: GNAT family N-acetyltransferase [Pseudomonadota bacterium]|jgi:hypothetical protein|nr:GNAT family N-acetyltransferase [Pseudomonadota bacterium]